jgi:hypothetical protein
MVTACGEKVKTAHRILFGLFCQLGFGPEGAFLLACTVN